MSQTWQASETKLALDCARSITGDKTDISLHPEDPRVVITVCCRQWMLFEKDLEVYIYTHTSIFQMFALFQYLHTVFYKDCCPLGNYKIA